MNQNKLSQNSALPEAVPGQRLILDTEQYQLPGETDGNGSFFNTTAFYIIVFVILLGLVGYFGWQFIKTSK